MKPILFRCSSLSDIMVNGRSKDEILGETAKSKCLETFLAHKYGYYEEIHTDGLMKGKLLESEGIAILRKHEDSFLIKNKNRKNNEYITGECDVVSIKGNCIYDVKIPENMRTFFRVDEVCKNYYAQAQGYMKLWGIDHYKLSYVLMPDSDEMIERKLSRLSYHLVGEDYDKAENQIKHNNKIIETMDISERIKIFEIDYDIDFMAKVEERVKVCREYISKVFNYPKI